MAVNSITASILEDTTTLENISEDIYSGELTAPSTGGDYTIQVTAYDDAGNVAVATSEVIEVSIWHTPKTDWKATDRFNFEDYNRIKNNLQWLHDKVEELYKPFEIQDMGEDITDYLSYWEAKYFNAWEQNLDIINGNMYKQDYGVAQRFFENGAFIQWNELNRLESATLCMRDILDREEAGLRRIPFRLGNFKGVRI